MAEADDILERELAQVSLEHAAIGILRLSIEGRILAANELSCRRLGYTRAELCGMTVFDINPTLTPAGWTEHRHRFVGHEEALVFESVHRRKSGTTFPVEVTVNYVQHGGREFFIACARDLTDQKLAEAERARLHEQLAHAQRLESIGRLAGGVAHDFNNLLTVILGHAELLIDRLPPGSTQRSDVEQIRAAAQRSAELTRQLLGFARRQPILPKALDLNRSVDELLKMLRRLIGEEVELTFEPAERLWPVNIDPAQVSQVLINLAVNARDAIPGSGRVVLATGNVTVTDPTSAPHRGLPPGEYVRLSVKDSGRGMTAEVLSHVFEPFFTTKEPGSGTGLGLATVFGIVRQNAGFVFAESAPGRGSTFTVYLPRDFGDRPVRAGADVREVPGGTGQVLLVEDDPQVLQLTHALLESLGYSALVARTPTEALTLVAKHGAEVAVLLADFALPEMTGRELAERVQAQAPRVGVVLMSGYAEGLALEPGWQFVAKPLERGELARSLRAALEAVHAG